jgi:hypothetical protein
MDVRGQFEVVDDIFRAHVVIKEEKVMSRKTQNDKTSKK